MKRTHEKGKASNGEHLFLYAVDDIYLPEYHYVVGGWFSDVSGKSQH
jgi:hypothetical protein